jgi:hypothetical protein
MIPSRCFTRRSPHFRNGDGLPTSRGGEPVLAGVGLLRTAQIDTDLSCGRNIRPCLFQDLLGPGSGTLVMRRRWLQGDSDHALKRTVETLSLPPEPSVA